MQQLVAPFGSLLLFRPMPRSNGFLDIGHGFGFSRALTKTAGKSGDFGISQAGLVLVQVRFGGS